MRPEREPYGPAQKYSSFFFFFEKKYPNDNITPGRWLQWSVRSPVVSRGGSKPVQPGRLDLVDLTGWLDCLSRLARLVWHARSTVQSISDTSYGSDLWFRGRTGPLVTNGVLVRASGRSIQFQRVGAKLSIISYPNYKICDVIGKPNKNTT